MYSILMPICWFGIGLVVDAIAPGNRLGIGGTIVVFLGVVILIRWLMARTHGRPFSKSESWRLIAYLTIWAALMESFVIIMASIDPTLFGVQIDRKVMMYVLPGAIAVDCLILVAAVKIQSPRFVAWYLRRNSQESA